MPAKQPDIGQKCLDVAKRRETLGIDWHRQKCAAYLVEPILPFRIRRRQGEDGITVVDQRAYQSGTIVCQVPRLVGADHDKRRMPVHVRHSQMSSTDLYGTQ